MPGLTLPGDRRSKRVMAKNRASLIINPDRKPERFPCLVVDSSKEGFRIRGTAGLRRGQMIEVVLDEEGPSVTERCRVVWVGKAGSNQEGEVGVEIV